MSNTDEVIIDWDDDSIADDYMSLILLFQKHLTTKYGLDGMDDLNGKLLLKQVVSASGKITKKLDDQIKALKKLNAERAAYDELQNKYLFMLEQYSGQLNYLLHGQKEIKTNLERLEANPFSGRVLRSITYDFDNTIIDRDIKRQKVSDNTFTSTSSTTNPTTV